MKLKVTVLISALSLLILFSINCGGANPESACEAYITEFARLIARCDTNYTFDTAYQEALKNSVCDCKNVVSVKDRDLLYNECLPALSRASCDAGDVRATVNNAACQGQLRIQGTVGLCN